MAPPFTVLYLRPEIASGFYRFPVDVTTAATKQDLAPSDAGDESAVATTTPFPLGVNPQEAVHLVPNGQIVSAIKQRLLGVGFQLADERMVQLTRPQARRLQLFASRSDSDVQTSRSAFLDRLTCGPTLVLLLTLASSTDPDAAVAALHALLGPEDQDPRDTRKQALSAGHQPSEWPLRALCGASADFPGVYGSATLDCAVRERHELLPSSAESLESAVVALLPSFQAALHDAHARLLAEFNRHGVVVTSTVEKPVLTNDELMAITDAELHAATDAAGREAFRSQLQRSAEAGATLVLRVVGLHVDATLRSILGPAAVDQAKRFFPESVRSQLPTAPFVVLEDHVRSRERTATCIETGVMVSSNRTLLQQLTPEDESITTTFAIIKPNAARNPATMDQIQLAVRAFGFSIDRQRRLKLSWAQAAAFYAEHAGKPFIARLLAYMTSGEIVALQLSRKLAVPLWRALMGPTNCLVAKDSYPWTLRARFGLDGTQNATHGSDAAASARRELRFFWGATTHNAPVQDADERAVARLAAKALSPPHRQDDSLETVLVRGLEQLLKWQQQEKEGSGGSLAACQWLGEWLLQQSEQSSLEPVATTRAWNRTPVTRTKAATGKETSPIHLQQQLPEDEYFVVAIVVDASVPPAAKDRAGQLIRDRVGALGFAFVDAANVPPKDLTQQLQASGRRRVVLFDWHASQPESTITSVATLTCQGCASPVELSTPLSPLVTHLAVEIPASIEHESSLDALFREVLAPRVVLVDDAPTGAETDTASESETESRTRWQRVADRYGFAYVAFDALVASEIRRERDPLGAFTQWKRTNAALSPSMLMDAIRRVVVDPATALALPGATHKFLLVGFPWTAAIDARALERSVGHVSAVVQIGGQSPREWSRVFQKRGLVQIVDATAQVEESVAHVLAPSVALVLGDGDVASVRRAAIASGHAWIDFASLPTAWTSSVDASAAMLRRLLLRKSSSLRRVVVHGFPRSPDEATAFVERVVAPSAVLVAASDSTKLPSPLQGALHIFTREAPHAVQSLVAPSSDAQLRGLLSCKSVACVVGDCSALDADALRTSLAGFGVGLIDLRGVAIAQPTTTFDAVLASHAPRCVVLGGPASVDHFQWIHAHLGDGLTTLFVLKQRQAQPPRKSRHQDDDYDSEEETQRETQRQREAAKLSPELSQLVQAFPRSATHATSDRSPQVDVVSFLHAREAHERLGAALQPRLVAVLGHAHTFYRDAARGACRLQQLPFVDLRSPPTTGFPAQLTRLRRVVAACSARVLVVDGFPRRDHATPLPPPYAAQQILQIERTTARMPLLVRFRASLDVLLDHHGARLSRNALEDAQDALDDATKELVACFARGATPTRILRDVSCEHECQDAQNAFSAILMSGRI